MKVGALVCLKNPQVVLRMSFLPQRPLEHLRTGDSLRATPWAPPLRGLTNMMSYGAAISSCSGQNWQQAAAVGRPTVDWRFLGHGLHCDQAEHLDTFRPSSADPHWGWHLPIPDPPDDPPDDHLGAMEPSRHATLPGRSTLGGYEGVRDWLRDRHL